ncbi:MAG: enoyl-CoA hydratase [Elusimicrobia bacterium RIFCSPHIGHO2_02_FULL_57_9]|nr:MAG: enoyl-CoA hydratase [Elusimicrobia bacterium RIFCSPHIGHO2_02_FULL_57_9]
MSRPPAGCAKEIRTEAEGPVGLITLNRPSVLNALNHPLMEGLVGALEDFERAPSIGCIIITGNAKAFAAGADIKEMDHATTAEISRDPHLSRWDRVGKCAKPVIAAVSGFALGGGCELALACDMIVASETAVFGQPEINIGVMPGAGGTQRLTRILGKTRAMEMVLTGKRMTAREALAAGLVNRVVPVESYLEQAKKLAHEIAAQPPMAVRMAKEAVLKALDVDLDAGLALERRLFYSLFDTGDQKEGMRAFIEKREPKFTGK